MKYFKKYSLHIFLVFLFIASFLLRVVSLPSFPPGFHFDEVNAGYNAYSLLQTGNSVRNGPWPLYLDTFGDYRPMGIVYIMMPSIAIFGLTEFAVRFPIALIGSLSPLLLFFLVRRLTKNVYLAGIAAAFLAISPWHITLSRATSEAVLAVFMAMVIVYIFSRLMEKGGITWAVLLYLFMALSYISYHPINLFLLLFFPFMIVIFWKELGQKQLTRRLAIGVFILYLIFPFLTGIMFGNSTGRLNQVVSVYSQEEQKHLQKQLVEEGHTGNIFIARFFHNKVVNATFELSERYAAYFSPQFLIFSGGLPKRYVTPDVGLINIVELLGLFLLFLPAAPIEKKKIFYLFLAWLLIGPLAAAITTDDHPNTSRAIMMIPALQVLAAYGFIRVFDLVPKKARSAFFIGGGLVVVIGIWHLFYFLHQYAIHEKYYQWLDRSFPAKEITQKLNQIDRNKKIIVTTNFLDPEMFVFFYNRIDPKIAQQIYAGRQHKDSKTLFNYTFVDEACPLQKHPTGYDYVVEHYWCIEPAWFPTTPIAGADGTNVFKLVEIIEKPEMKQ